METTFPGMAIRYQMDLRLYLTLLDHLVQKRYKELGDVVAQQLKATEQALEDQGSWERAKYISLIEESGNKLVKINAR